MRASRGCKIGRSSKAGWSVILLQFIHQPPCRTTTVFEAANTCGSEIALSSSLLPPQEEEHSPWSQKVRISLQNHRERQSPGDVDEDQPCACKNVHRLRRNVANRASLTVGADGEGCSRLHTKFLRLSSIIDEMQYGTVRYSTE